MFMMLMLMRIIKMTKLFCLFLVVLDSFWLCFGFFGSFLVRFWLFLALFGFFGLFWAPFWLLFAPSWAKMEPKWRQVGPRWSQNGAKLASKTDLGALLGDLCGSGMPRDALGRDLGPQNDPKWSQLGTKNRRKMGHGFESILRLIFDRVWVDFGSIGWIIFGSQI